MLKLVKTSQRTGLWLLAGFAAPPLVAGGLVPIERFLPPPSLALILVVPVVVVAYSGSRAAATIGAFSAAASFDVLFTEPRGSFTIANANDIVLVVTLLAVGLLVAQASALRLRQDVVANRMITDVAVLRAIAEMLAAGEGTDQVAMTASYWLRRLLDLRDCRLSLDLRPPSPASITPFGEVRVGALLWAADIQGLPGPELDLPLHADGAIVARFVLTPEPGHKVSKDSLFTAVAVADLVGASLGGSQRRARVS
jgi:hypothetical protein